MVKLRVDDIASSLCVGRFSQGVHFFSAVGDPSRRPRSLTSRDRFGFRLNLAIGAIDVKFKATGCTTLVYFPLCAPRILFDKPEE